MKFRGARRKSKEKSNRGKKAENVGRLAFFSSVSLVRGLCVQLLEISWEDQETFLLLQFLIIEQRSMSHQGKPSTSTAPTPDAAQFVSRGGKGGRGRGGGGGRGQSLNKQQQKTYVFHAWITRELLGFAFAPLLLNIPAFIET